MGYNVTDFKFSCGILYAGNEGAIFDVALTYDGVPDENRLKTTDASGKTVVFNSTDLRGHFGTEVSKTLYFTLDSSVAVVVTIIIIST